VRTDGSCARCDSQLAPNGGSVAAGRRSRVPSSRVCVPGAVCDRTDAVCVLVAALSELVAGEPWEIRVGADSVPWRGFIRGTTA